MLKSNWIVLIIILILVLVFFFFSKIIVFIEDLFPKNHSYGANSDMSDVRAGRIANDIEYALDSISSEDVSDSGFIDLKRILAPLGVDSDSDDYGKVYEFFGRRLVTKPSIFRFVPFLTFSVYKRYYKLDDALQHVLSDSQYDELRFILPYVF